MAYTTVTAVKRILQISESDTSLDAEISEALPTGDAYVYNLLKADGLSVPTPVPQSIGMLLQTKTYLFARMDVS